MRDFARDPGAPFRRTDAPGAKQGGIYKLDGDQWTFTNGKGDRFWFVDTTAGAVTVTLPDAGDVAPDTMFVVKRLTAGANALTVSTVAGTIDGAATKSLASQWDVGRYVAFNGNYYTV